ncbi:MAG: hypothetical protein KDN22_10925 [Verrucomicrobiae bacterium]|nr:hypothetical protein [Verrucomicrobiae bacterium]
MWRAILPVIIIIVALSVRVGRRLSDEPKFTRTIADLMELRTTSPEVLVGITATPKQASANLGNTVKKSGEAIPAALAKTEFGKSVKIGRSRDFIYPTKFDLPKIEDSVLLPATPVDFTTEKVGMMMELTPERRSGLVLLKGTVTMTVMERMISAQGEIFLPISDSKTSMNKVELPVFRKYVTPVMLAAVPGKSYTIEIDSDDNDLKAQISVSLEN